MVVLKIACRLYLFQISNLPSSPKREIISCFLLKWPLFSDTIFLWGTYFMVCTGLIKSWFILLFPKKAWVTSLPEKTWSLGKIQKTLKTNIGPKGHFFPELKSKIILWLGHLWNLAIFLMSHVNCYSDIQSHRSLHYFFINLWFNNHKSNESVVLWVQIPPPMPTMLTNGSVVMVTCNGLMNLLMKTVQLKAFIQCEQKTAIPLNFAAGWMLKCIMWKLCSYMIWSTRHHQLLTPRRMSDGSYHVRKFILTLGLFGRRIVVVTCVRQSLTQSLYPLHPQNLQGAFNMTLSWMVL